MHCVLCFIVLHASELRYCSLIENVGTFGLIFLRFSISLPHFPDFQWFFLCYFIRCDVPMNFCSFKNSDIPCQYYYLEVTDASLVHDACRGQGLNGAHCDETVAAAHGCGCYCYCYFGCQFDVVSFSCFSCGDSGTRFSPISREFVESFSIEEFATSIGKRGKRINKEENGKKVTEDSEGKIKSDSQRES